MIFTLATASELIELNTGITTNLGQWLEETKSTTGIYRPYFVIGLLLWLKPENNLIKGEGAQFDQNIETSRRYLIWQKSLDTKFGLEVPLQYTCDAILNQMGEAESKPSTQIGFIAF